ncbi:MAG: glycosyltransferase [Lachnospiraceae bacterium]|nr:glycosyltransferase [Lachnospiraceae bacterium]
MDKYINHTFAICAYKESRYLEECIKSLINQKAKSHIFIATSTPNDYIKGLSEKYNLPYYINEGEKGITQDWNFAYSKADTKYITIVHQDDIYYEEYSENMIKYMESVKKPLIFFSDYSELRNGETVVTNNLLKIKRILLFPLRFRFFWNSRFVRRRSLSLGSAICCPAVTFAKENLEFPVFKNHFRTNEDWEAWENISKCKGSFVFCNKILMSHRIHEESETSATIKETGRYAEDIEMFEKFWPKCIAKIIAKAYGTSEKSNDL